MSADSFQDFWATWQRIIAGAATAPDEQFLNVFHNFIREGAQYCIPHGLDRIAFVDRTQEIAESFGYVERFGQDALQSVLQHEIQQVEIRDRVPPEINGHDTDAPTVLPLPFFDAAEFDGVAVPQRRWLVKGRLPMRNVSLLSGDGAIGKTTIALQLAVNVAMGHPDWLGAVIDEVGPVLFYTAEEERDELHFRLDMICRHYGVAFGDLAAKLMLHCGAGEDCVLATVNRQGLLDATKVYQSLGESLKRAAPKLVIIESAADVYGGNENDRAQVRQFVRLLRALAVTNDCSVLLLTHPSMSGMASGKGTSGTTAWNNSVRSRLYFAKPQAGDDDDDSDTDLRELTLMKANFAASGEKVGLVYRDGVFIRPGSQSAHESEARNAQAEHVFLTLLRSFIASGRAVSPSRSATYAPTLFEREDAAKKAGLRSKALGEAMSRLFDKGAIEAVSDGPPSRRRTVIQPKAPVLV